LDTWINIIVGKILINNARPKMAPPNSIHPYISPPKKTPKKEKNPKPYFLTRSTV
jgi:hypothetical protein